MMRVEEFDSAIVDPSGRWAVFERLRPYDRFSDYSFRTYAFAKSGHQLWRYDLHGNGEPELLPGIAAEPHSYQQGFSPSGRFLTVMQYSFGELALAAYDMASEQLLKFGPTPAFSRAGEHNPVWISDEELAFSAVPEGEWPAFTSARAYTGKMLAGAWEAAWRGATVTADEVRTIPEDRSNVQEAGFLVRANARTGRTETIAEGLYADLRVSPDGRWLAALAVSKPQPADPQKLALEDRRRYTLAIFALETGKMRLLANELEFFPYTIAWAPDSQRLAAFGWKPGDTPRDGRFHVVDVDTGAVRRYDHVGADLTSERERSWLQRPERAAFLGDALAVFARPIPASESQDPRFTYQHVRPEGLAKPDWYALSSDGTLKNLTSGLPGVSGVPIHAANDHLTVWAQDGAYRLRADGERHRMTPALPGRFRYLPPGTFATRGQVIRPEFGEQALFDVRGDGSAKIVMVDMREGQEGSTVTIEAPVAGASPLAGSFSMGAVLFRTEDGQATRLMLAKGQGAGAPKPIASINSHLADIDFGTWKIVTYEVPGPEGAVQTIDSCVLLPANFDPGRPPPLIVEVYPGVAPRCNPGDRRIAYPDPHSPYLWAGRGYAYARLATPRERVRTQDGPIAGMSQVIDAGVDALVEAGFADPERLALHGFSQGGVSALYVAAHSTRFKAVMAMNSWANFFSHYFGGAGVYTYGYGNGQSFGNFVRYDAVAGGDFGIGQSAFDVPDVYIRNSPVFLAPRIEAPVFLVHSDMDSFSMSQFDEMYTALLRAGKDARYVRYWGEGHGPSSPANIRDMWERKLRFLEEQGVAP